MLNTILFSALLASLAAGVLSPQGEWPAYGYDQHGQRYSPVAQINVNNVSKLKVAWQYGVAPGAVDLDPANRVLTATEAVPIMAGGVLFTPTLQHTLVALEPETGKELW